VDLSLVREARRHPTPPARLQLSVDAVGCPLRFSTMGLSPDSGGLAGLMGPGGQRGADRYMSFEGEV